jgi:hypothetical protein
MKNFRFSGKGFFSLAIVIGASSSSFAVIGLDATTFLGSQSDFFAPTNTFAGNSNSTGALVTANGSKDFTGLDRSGNTQTSNFSGSSSASSSYGRLRSQATATLTNTFYNSSNAANGNPNIFVAVGQAGFTDKLTFTGGSILPTHKVRYIYFISGQMSGTECVAALVTNIGASSESVSFNSASGSQIAQYFTTNLYDVSGTFQQDVRTTFLSSFQTNTQFKIDGSTLTGAANFSSTATLTGIEMFDASGNRVTNFTVTSESGTAYSTVPEPATFIACGLGIAGILRKRSKRS